MRVLAVHPELIVFISRVWQTTCTAVRAGGEAFVIDSPVYPDELDALAGVLEQAGFPVAGLLVTHGDWDHLLGRLAFPSLSLGCGEATARRLADEPGAAQRELRRFDAEQYVAGRAPLALAGVQELPVPGRLALGGADGEGESESESEGEGEDLPSERELELHPAGGHTADGTAYLIPWLRVLVCGDYLSPVEIPVLAPGGSAEGYLATLERLAALIPGTDTVVPGHGAPLAREQALDLLEQDRAYLRATIRDGVAAPLPAGRASRTQRRIHEANVSALRG